MILVGFDNPATDNAAKAKLEEWFPNRDVYVIEMLESWIAGGGVHCHSNDQPAASTIGTPPRTVPALGLGGLALTVLLCVVTVFAIWGRVPGASRHLATRQRQS